MSNNIESLVGKRHRFQALVVSFATKPGYKGQPIEILTLKDVRLEGEEAILLPEIEFNKGAIFKDVQIEDGLTFNARLVMTTRRSTGDHDYRLERPNNLTRQGLSEKAIKALLFTTTDEALRASQRLNGMGFHAGMVIPYETHTVVALSLMEALTDDDQILLRCCALLVVIAEGMNDERSLPFVLTEFERLLDGSSVLGPLTLYQVDDAGELTVAEEERERWLSGMRRPILLDNLPSFTNFFEIALKEPSVLKVALGRVEPARVIQVEVEQVAEHVKWVREQWGDMRLFPTRRMLSTQETLARC